MRVPFNAMQPIYHWDWHERFEFVLAHKDGTVPRSNADQRLDLSDLFGHRHLPASLLDHEAEPRRPPLKRVLQRHPEWRGKSDDHPFVRGKQHTATLTGAPIPWGYFHRPDVMARLGIQRKQD